MREILAISANTIREGLRNKMFYILLGIAFVFVLVGRGCMSGSMNIQNRELSPEQMVSFGTIIGFFIITFWGLTLAGLLSMGAILTDIETGVITTFISKPISRFEYLMGKFIGIVAVVLLNVAILALGFSILAYLRAGIFPLHLFLALGVFVVNLLMLISFILLVSLVSARIIAMIFGILAYLFSVGIAIPVYIDALRDKMVGSSMSPVLEIIYFAFPQWGSAHIYAASLIYAPLSQRMSYLPVAHSLLYTVVIWLLMLFVVAKKEF